MSNTDRNARLAKALGWQQVQQDIFKRWTGIEPVAVGLGGRRAVPDFDTDPAASRALLEWLATQSQKSRLDGYTVWQLFLVEMQMRLFQVSYDSVPLDVAMNLLIAPIPMIAEAADAAIADPARLRAPGEVGNEC